VVTRDFTEYRSILKKYEIQKMNTYKVAQLLGDDYLFTDGNEDDSRYAALINCGTLLGFCRDSESGVVHLKAANFCRQRVCPMCQFRKSEKMFADMLQVVELLRGKYRFLHMVLTIPNSKYDIELVNGVKLLYKAFGNLIHSGKPKKAFKGVLRCLEVSYNYDNDTFHPHLHCLVAVKPSYFNDTKVYMSVDEIRKLWTAAVNNAIAKMDGVDFARSDAELQCSIRAIREGDYRGIAEVCKYCLKPLNLDKSDNERQNKRVLLSLWHSLKGARFVQKYGVIKEAFKEIGTDGTDFFENVQGDESMVFFTWDGRTLKYRSD
jgi:plasmid rolling circle replication initiator protein Rep